MARRRIKITRLRCANCGHEWAPRQPDVRICPNCKSARWDGSSAYPEGGEGGFDGAESAGTRAEAE